MRGCIDSLEEGRDYRRICCHRMCYLWQCNQSSLEHRTQPHSRWEYCSHCTVVCSREGGDEGSEGSGKHSGITS